MIFQHIIYYSTLTEIPIIRKEKYRTKKNNFMKFKSLPDTTQLSAFYLDCNMLNLHSPSQSISGVLSTALLASSIPTWMPFRLFTNTFNELPSLSKYQLFPQSGRHPTCIAPQIHGIQLPLRDIIFSSPAVDSLGTWLIFHSWASSILSSNFTISGI